MFALGDDRDQSSAQNRLASDGTWVGPGNQTFAQSIRAYQLRGRAPLGAGELTAQFSQSDNGVSVTGGSVTPNDLTHRDRRYDGALTWQRSFATSQFALGGYSRYESLDFATPASLLGQTIDVAYARGGLAPTPALHLDGGVFESTTRRLVPISTRASARCTT